MGVALAHLRLVENGSEVKPEKISGQGETGPLTTLLIIDTSGGMNQAGKLTVAQIAAHAYIDQMHVSDQAGVLAFNTEAQVTWPKAGGWPGSAAVFVEQIPSPVLAAPVDSIAPLRRRSPNW